MVTALHQSEVTEPSTEPLCLRPCHILCKCSRHHQTSRLSLLQDLTQEAEELQPQQILDCWTLSQCWIWAAIQLQAKWHPTSKWNVWHLKLGPRKNMSSTVFHTFEKSSLLLHRVKISGKKLLLVWGILILQRREHRRGDKVKICLGQLHPQQGWQVAWQRNQLVQYLRDIESHGKCVCH